MGYVWREVCREIKPGLYARDKTYTSIWLIIDLAGLLINKMHG